MIHFVEDVIHTDTWFEEGPLHHIETMRGMQVPHTKAWGILVSTSIIGLRLQTAVQIDIQTISAPRVVVVGIDGSSMTNATFQNRPLVATLRPGVGIGIVGSLDRKSVV